MPEGPVAAAGGAAAGQNGQQQPRAGGGIVATVLRMVFFWWVMNYFKGGNQKAGSTTGDNFVSPRYSKGKPLDMYAYVTDIQSPAAAAKELIPIWVEKDLKLAVSPARSYNYSYIPSEAVKNNGSVFLHLGFVVGGVQSDIQEVDAIPQQFDFFKTIPLNYYMAKPKNKTGVSLLKSDSEQLRQLQEQRANETERVVLNFWRPNCTVVMVDHFTTHSKPAVPPQLKDMLDLDDDGQHYYPIITNNDFWVLKENFVSINATTEKLDVLLTIAPQNFWWFSIQQQIEQSFQMQTKMGMSNEGESEEVKRIFLEGNPYFLGLTMFVSMLHTVFDMLAFKNDIGFWKNNKSMEGLSARSVLINAGCQLVILLYLFDNETSFVVLLSSVLGTAIEFWKVTKAMDVTFDPHKFPYVQFGDRATYAKNKTKQYDEEATRYLSYVLYPLVLGYGIYSLMYQTHKSWYSWILTSLVGAVYMFGFILMCPQLYLNYKLKSVAHLPWRQMTYKFLNTIIDDLFAFVIKMPTLHRLSVFRDDVIFLIYLYQRWAYRVDKTRVNEFGYTEVDAGVAEALEGEEPVALLEGPEASTSGAQKKEEASAAGAKEKEEKAAAGAKKKEEAAGVDKEAEKLEQLYNKCTVEEVAGEDSDRAEVLKSENEGTKKRATRRKA